MILLIVVWCPNPTWFRSFATKNGLQTLQVGTKGTLFPNRSGNELFVLVNLVFAQKTTIISSHQGNTDRVEVPRLSLRSSRDPVVYPHWTVVRGTSLQGSWKFDLEMKHQYSCYKQGKLNKKQIPFFKVHSSPIVILRTITIPNSGSLSRPLAMYRPRVEPQGSQCRKIQLKNGGFISFISVFSWMWWPTFRLSCHQHLRTRFFSSFWVHFFFGQATHAQGLVKLICPWRASSLRWPTHHQPNTKKGRVCQVQNAKSKKTVQQKKQI